MNRLLALLAAGAEIALAAGMAWLLASLLLPAFFPLP
jgi:hypothetical protein